MNSHTAQDATQRGLALSESGVGLPVICLHSIGLDRNSWARFARRIGAAHRVVAVDLPGHGGSLDRTEGAGLADDAGRVAMLLDKLETGPVIVVGVSMGGMVAQELALARPDLVCGLVLGACPPGISEQNREGLRARGQPALAHGMEYVADAMIPRWFSSAFREDAAAVAARDTLLRHDPMNWARGWAAIAEFDRRDDLGKITCPVLCLAGGEDPATPLAAMEHMAEGVPDGRLEIIESGPHMLHIETADAFTAAVTRFIRAHF
ncbi:alpha/beta fold hydrolase [Citreimonas sp.]|uniref:alpha/beta fold hydrolase n=1 Tax=Citreimonas sp. TaxID=3036715 RepID=UPI004058DC4E